MKYSLFAVLLLIGFISLIPYSFADLIVNDRLKIDSSTTVTSDGATLGLEGGDLFGYQIEAIGDLNSDGVTDLATIKFSDDSNEANVGSILILFMNSDGSVSSTNEIVMDGTASGLNGCIANDSTNRDTGSLEQLAFVGDLDSDGKPTIALGANSNDHPIADSGAVYMLELNSDGTVDNCVLITEDSNGFDPGAGVYRQSGEGQVANFGWPVIATDLNGDGQNELIVGATSDDDNYTDLWVLFLTSTGAVSSHPATPISGNTDIGIDSGEFLSGGKSISGTKIVVSNENDGDGGGSVFIVNLSSTGAFVSSTEIAGSSIAGIANDERFGSGVTPLGDLDNNGVNDILVGNEAGDDTNSLSGEAHILFLNADDTLKDSQKISNESENTRTGSTPFAASDLFGHGMTLWRNSGGSVVIAISAHQDDTGASTDYGAIYLFYLSVVVSSGSGSGGCNDCIPPTLGINKRGINMVDNGFSFNGNYINVEHRYTPFPLITTQVGVNNTMTFKIFENHGINDITNAKVALGMPNQFFRMTQADVFLDINFLKGMVTDIEIKDNQFLIQNVTAFTDEVKCKESSNKKECLEVTLHYSYRESPMYNMVTIAPVDDNGLWWPVYFNHGIKVEGDSLNPSKTVIIAGKFYTQLDKWQDNWIDEQGIEYDRNSIGTTMIRTTPLPDYVCSDTPLDEINGGYGRDNCHFRALTPLFGLLY